MEEQLEGLADPRSREVATLLYRLQVLLQGGEALGYTLEDLASQYEELYRGWDASDEPAEQVRHQTEVALDTIQAVLLSTQAFSHNDIPAQRAISSPVQAVIRPEAWISSALVSAASSWSFR